MTRPGTKAAQLLLEEVAWSHHLDHAAMLTKGHGCPRFDTLIAAKQDFCRQGKALGIPIMTMAMVLHLHHASVINHLNPADQARRQRRRKAMARARHREGLGWSVPVWSGGYQHLYQGGQVVQARLE
jgi:hypothetical protein